MPWKVKRLFQRIVGDDYLYNKATFKPDFTFESFKYLLPESALPEEPNNKQQLVAFFLKSTTNNSLIISRSALLEHQKCLPNPTFKAQLLTTANQLCTKHYAVYHQLLAPTNGEFAWHDLKKGPNNDQLYMSRPQRFGFAPVIAQAALFEPQYISKLLTIFRTWQAYATGSKYRWPYNSSHALVYRVIALIMTWQFIAANVHSHNDKNDLLFEILNILKSDVAYLAPRLGHAHPNNHLLADYFVGWLINATFPELISSEFDFSKYEVLWQKELLRQFYSDGGCFEHAVHYHEHGCEMALIYRLMSDEKSLPNSVNERIGNMLKYQIRLNGQYQKPWPLGDTTEDTLLPLDHTTGWSCALLAAAYNKVYQKQPQNKLSNIDNKTYWLLGNEGFEQPDSINNINHEHLPFCHYFPDSGMVHWLSESQQSEWLFRTGVIADTSFMPGHMHADILSFYWRIKGIDILAASGTYSYKYANTDKINYRNYFCGPESHSAVIINGQDPLGELTGDFRDKDNGLRVTQHIFGDPSIACVAVGQVISDNIYHGLTRSVLQRIDGDSLVIDILTEQQQVFPVKANWYLGNKVTAQIHAGQVDLQVNNNQVASIISSQNQPTAISSQVGWQSHSYGELLTNQVISIAYEQGKKVYATLLTMGVKTRCDVIEDQGNSKYCLIKLVQNNVNEMIYYAFTDSCEVVIGSLHIVSKTIIHQKYTDGRETIQAVGCCSVNDDSTELNELFSETKTLIINKEQTHQHWVFV